jgi:hypothetical protein
LILVAPPFIFMKSSKTSDPKPISLYRALTRPLQTHMPAMMIQQTGARRSDVVCTSLKSDSPWDGDQRRPKIDRPAEPPDAWVWVVVVEPAPALPKVAPPDTVVVVTEVVVVSVAVTVVVVSVVVDSDTSFVVELALCTEELSLDCETAVDVEGAELAVVEVEEAALLAWRE